MQMLKLRKTIAAKAWHMPGPADYVASCDSDSARPALPSGKHPSIPSLHHLPLGWHNHFSSCMTCILPAQKQQAGPSLSKQLLPVATPVQEFPVWSQKKHSSHSFAAIAQPDCRNQASSSFISLAKWVPSTSRASICNLLWLHESLFCHQTREFPGKKSYNLNAGKGRKPASALPNSEMWASENTKKHPPGTQ